MIDRESDPGAWAFALAAPCRSRRIEDFNPIPAPPFQKADHPGRFEARPARRFASACGCPVHASSALKDGNGAFFLHNGGMSDAEQ